MENFELSRIAQEAAEAMPITVEELKGDASEEKINRYVEGLVAQAEAEDSTLKSVLEAKPGQAVDRRSALKENIVSTLKVRVDGLVKGLVSNQDFEKGVRKALAERVEGYRKKAA